MSAVVSVPAQANHGKPGHHSPSNHSHSPSSKGRCGVVNRGFIVTGNHATFTVTQNTDGTWDGSVTLIATSANSHAHKSGVNSTDQNSESFTLDNAKIIFGPDVTDTNSDNAVGPDDVQPTDTVKLIGKIPYEKKGGHGSKACPDSHDFGSDRYGDPKIRQVTVNRQGPPAATAA